MGSFGCIATSRRNFRLSFTDRNVHFLSCCLVNTFLFCSVAGILKLFVSLLPLTQIILFMYCQFSFSKALGIFLTKSSFNLLVWGFVCLFFCCFSALTPFTSQFLLTSSFGILSCTLLLLCFISFSFFPMFPAIHPHLPLHIVELIYFH